MRSRWFLFTVVAVLLLSGCGNSGHDDHAAMDHASMEHDTSGEMPKGLKAAANPKYPIGSEAKTQADHMAGMKGATVKIVGAYETTVYAVTYTPTTGGELVRNHKWVVHEEIEQAGSAPLQPGAKVKLAADHMAGMNGATATIDSAEQTTVYVFDFVPTTGGAVIKNHKWVTESELSR